MNRILDKNIRVALTLISAAAAAGAAASALRLGLFARADATGRALELAAVALAVSIAAWHRTLASALRRGARAPGRAIERDAVYPSITVVRPVRGRDVGAAANFAAALDTGYPGAVETLFVFDDENDPGLPIARAAVEAHRAAGRPGSAQVLVAGAPPPGRTGKLNAMILGEQQARGELIAFGDSDTRPDRNVLRGTVDALLSSPGSGSAFAPIVVHRPPQALGDVFYALMQNALYAPLANQAAGEARALPFIMGQLMVFRREALLAIGGVACAEGQLVDDMHIGTRLHRAGYLNILGTAPLHIHTGGLSLRQFLPIYRRWMMFSRNGLPTSFVWRQWVQGVEFFLALAGAAASIATAHGAAALLFALALGMQGLSLLSLQQGAGGAVIPARWSWAPFAIFLLSPFVLLQNQWSRKVDWRGREYRVSGLAALAPARGAAGATPPRLAPAARSHRATAAARTRIASGDSAHR